MSNHSFSLTFLVSASVGFAIFLGYRIGYLMGSQPKKVPRKRRPMFKMLKGGKQ